MSDAGVVVVGAARVVDVVGSVEALDVGGLVEVVDVVAAASRDVDGRAADATVVDVVDDVVVARRGRGGRRRHQGGEGDRRRTRHRGLEHAEAVGGRQVDATGDRQPPDRQRWKVCTA